MSRPTEIRCDCHRRPLLAIADRTEDGEPFIHVKAYKQKALIVELVALTGDFRIRCRTCHRWHRIRVRVADWDAELHDLPEKIPLQ